MKPIERLVVDANPVLSAVLGGAAREVFFHLGIEEFAIALPTLREVETYIPRLAAKPKVAQAGVTEELLFAALTLLPLTVYPRRFYRAALKEAQRRIGSRDPKDVDVLALALKLGAPIWSNDEDFADVGVPRYTTAELLRWLKQG